MRRRVVVTGLGVISPIGLNTEAFWKSILEGKSGVDTLTAFDRTNFDSKVSGEVKDFNPADHMNSKEIRRTDRFVQFAIVAARMAVKDSGLDFNSEDKNRAGVIIGSGIGGLHTIERQVEIYLTKGPSRLSPYLIPMLIVNMASGMVSIEFGVSGPNSSVATACASGNHAIGDAFKVIQRGAADVMLTGGAEACVTPVGFGGFCAMKALSTKFNDRPKEASRPFDRERDGFIMSEGAGIVILEEYEHARKRGAEIYCEITGYGATGDAYHMTAPNPDGETAAECLRIAMEDAGTDITDIDYINAHGTSTVLNDKIETLAIKKVFKERAKELMVSSTKSMTGHLLGAAGGVEFAACALAIKHGKVPPTINYKYPDPECDLDYVPNETRDRQIKQVMSNSLGFGGHNATVVLKRM
jgi:3-oxoacyl-[acyl-carrier-protein] synthase II